MQISDPLTGHAAAPKPLAGHALFHSSDLDEARESVARVFCPHRLDIIGQGATDARHHRVAGDALSFNFIEYGAKTLISPGELGSFYLLQIPMTGGAAIRNGRDEYYSADRYAAVLNPHRATTMIWEEGTQQLLVQIDRAAMQEHLGKLTGRHITAPITFDGPLDLSSGVGQTLRHLVFHVVNEIDANRSPLGNDGMMRRQLESTIMTGLIEALPHNHAHLLGMSVGTATPWHLRRAEAFIAENLARAITIEDIADAARTTPRTLQNAFRKFRDTTPLRYLRDARLARAHQDLSAADPRESVTNIATRWGFTHLGRFSQFYRERFGETPQATLRDSGRKRWSD